MRVRVSSVASRVNPYSTHSASIGDQAEIKFTLIGEPPFTFTYQRSELSSRKGGSPGKVLETHTVSGVTTTEYSIFSALEGQHITLQILTLVDNANRCMDGHFYRGPPLSIPASPAGSNLGSKIVTARRVSLMLSVFLDDSDHANESTTIITFIVEGPVTTQLLCWQRQLNQQTNSSSFYCRLPPRV